MRIGPGIGLAAMVAIVVLGGCSSPCETYCDVTVEKLQDLNCMDVWGTSWEEQSYEDEADFLQRCVATFDQRMEDAGAASAEAAEDVEQGCSDALGELEGVEDCSAVLLHEL
jgi:hypothetical protein